jgi:hypothetical protein
VGLLPDDPGVGTRKGAPVDLFPSREIRFDRPGGRIHRRDIQNVAVFLSVMRVPTTDRGPHNHNFWIMCPFEAGR